MYRRSFLKNNVRSVHELVLVWACRGSAGRDEGPRGWRRFEWVERRDRGVSNNPFGNLNYREEDKPYVESEWTEIDNGKTIFGWYSVWTVRHCLHRVAADGLDMRLKTSGCVMWPQHLEEMNFWMGMGSSAGDCSNTGVLFEHSCFQTVLLSQLYKCYLLILVRGENALIWYKFRYPGPAQL